MTWFLNFFLAIIWTYDLYVEYKWKTKCCNQYHLVVNIWALACLSWSDITKAAYIRTLDRNTNQSLSYRSPCYFSPCLKHCGVMKRNTSAALKQTSKQWRAIYKLVFLKSERWLQFHHINVIYWQCELDDSQVARVHRRRLRRSKAFSAISSVL